MSCPIVIPEAIPWTLRLRMRGAWWIASDRLLALRWTGEGEPAIGELATARPEMVAAPEQASPVQLARVGLAFPVDEEPDWLVWRHHFGRRGEVSLDWIGPVAVNRRMVQLVERACHGDQEWRAAPRWDGFVSAWVGGEPVALFRGHVAGELVQPAGRAA